MKIMHIPDHVAVQSALALCPDVCLAVLFGSTATGRGHEDSDIDLGILLDRCPMDGPSLADYRRLITGLSMIFPSHLLDIAILNNADPVFQLQVIRHGHVIFERNPGDLKRFVIQVARDLQDSEYQRRRRLKWRVAAIQQEVSDGGSGNLLKAARGVARLFNQTARV